MNFVKSAIRKYSLIKIFLFLGDFIALFVAVIIILSIAYKMGFYLRNPFYKPEQIEFYLTVSLLTLLSFKYFNLYKRKIYLTLFDQFIQLFKSIILSSFLLIIINFFAKSDSLDDNPRAHYLLFIFVTLTITFFYRTIFLKMFFKKSDIKNFFTRRIIAVGAGKIGIDFSGKIRESKFNYFDLVGFVDDDINKKDKVINGFPVLGNTGDLENIIPDYNIDEIFITIESISYTNLMELITHCKKSGNQVNLVSSHYHVIDRKFDRSEFDDFHYTTISSSLISIYPLLLKGILDKILTGIILLPLFPVLLLIGILIKLSSKGPVFYKTQVVGKNGTIFTWYKFRTMIENNDQELHQKHLEKIITQNTSVEKLKNDPRITKFGKYLRKFSLDELPQLFSVLKGDMSLIGPRPCLTYEYELMDDWQKKRTSVTPGITGLWQVTGRNKKDVSFNDSMVLDLYYSENQSFGLDVKILIKTIPVVLFGNGGT